MSDHVAMPGGFPESTGRPLSEVCIDDRTAVTTAVADAVAPVSDRSAVELPPLHHFIDVDAVNDVFSNRSAEGNVTFPYMGFPLRVRRGHEVAVYE